MASIRTYQKEDCIVFRKTSSQYGHLSNMASGYPIQWNDIKIKSSEALYQSLRYPDRPDIQKQILNENSPMTAKMISKKYYNESRPDWLNVRFQIMRFCLEIKLAHNWASFSEVLASTGDKAIVEYAPNGKVWGAVDKGDHYEGVNALGRLLMELRLNYISNKTRESIRIPNVGNLIIFGIDATRVDLQIKNYVSE